MKLFIRAFVLILATLLLIDSIWIMTMYQGFYSPNIGNLLAEKINLLPLLIFYMVYSIGLAILVVLPSLRHGEATLETLIKGILFGLVAYGAYDLTNDATLKNWSLIVTVVDIAWGAVLTGLVTLSTLLMMRKIMQE